jgi:enamine deaminase RidA (YjgF/YER057c/UK114 family)
MYLVKYCGGDMDDFYSVDIFITSDKKKAERYVRRFNRILAKWKSYFKSLEDESGWPKDEHVDMLHRWYTITSVNKCYITTIKIRE